MVAFATREAWRHSFMPARKALATAAEHAGKVDRFVGVAQFRGGRRGAGQVLSFGALAVDLDVLGADADALAREVLAFISTTKLPKPAAIVATGNRGVHLWWLFTRRVPAAAAPR